MKVDLGTFLLVELVIGLAIVGFFVVKKLIKKNEILEEKVISYESYIDMLSNVISQSNEHIEQIDARGTFRSDDEIGTFFENIKLIQNSLNEFRINNSKSN